MQQRDVEILASNAGRMVVTPGHEAARGYITERLIQIGIKGYDEGSHELPYQRDGGSFVNVVGASRGEIGSCRLYCLELTMTPADLTLGLTTMPPLLPFCFR